MRVLTRTEINCLCARSYLNRLRRAPGAPYSEILGALWRSQFADRQMLRLAIGRALGVTMVEIILVQDPDHPEWTNP